MINDLALILIVASTVTLLFKKLKQPLVLGYIMAGFIVSPHMPYTMSVMDTVDIKTWADIGVMFLLFSLGLDFSFKKILKMGITPVITTLTIIFAMMTLGIVVGHAFDWKRMDCIFLGGMLAMSSTTIIYKAFTDMGLRQQKFAQPVMSVLILEDILAIVMMVMLSAIASGNNPDGGEMIGSVMKIGFFLVLWFVVGIFLAETIEAAKIEKLVSPVKDLFGAVFFVSVGMLVDPKIIVEYAIPIAVLVLTILIGQSIFGTFGFLIGGQSLKSAMRCGFSMAQIGEFSFIIASLGLSLHVTGEFLYPVVVAVSVITTFLTPYMIRLSVPSYNVLERHLPKTWVRALNNITLSHPSSAPKSNWHSLIAQMARITIIYSILSVATIALMLTFFLPFIRRMMPGMHWWANGICGVLTVMFIAPFLRAIVMKKNHSEEFRALWNDSRSNRMPLLVTILVRLIIASAFVFYICNYLTRFTNALMMTIALAVVGIMILSRGLKKQSIKMERMFVQNLRSRDIEQQVLGLKKPLYEGHLLDRDIHISEIEIPENSTWSGLCLADLRLSNRFGIHVSSILRGHRRINIPGGDDIVFPGDKLQVIGSDSQLAAAHAALAVDIEPDDPDIEKREMRLSQIIIDKHSPFVGKTLPETGLRSEFNCMVVGREEGKENLSMVGATYKMRLGDILWIVGEDEALRRLQDANRGV